MLKFICFAVVFILLLSGCTNPAPTGSETTMPAAPSLILSETASLVLLETPAAAFTPSPVLPQVCSPLAGVRIDDLAGMIVNPYHPPKPGSDDPHQGVDLARLSGPGGIALTGMPVEAVLSGKVAGKAADRFPYGNMLIIETPLDPSISSVLPAVVVPTPLPERLPPGTLTCPEMNIQPAASGAARSLYVLYAHMQNPVAAEVGDEINCGQQLGEIGSSGNALNPHVHIEVRVGPSDQTFPSMAHYDPSAGYAEMAAYCTWRVSGVYQTVDPGCLWGECSSP